MLSSLLLVALLLFNFREPLEDMLDVSLAGLFSWENIWAPLSVIVSILRLFSKDIFWISLPAVFLGELGTWYIGGVWIEQFVEGVDFGICGFLLIACIVLLLIIGCVVFKAWWIANENPVDSIKSE